MPSLKQNESARKSSKSAAQILANDGNYELRFVPSRKRYVAGCRALTREEAIEHWSDRAKTGKCHCSPGCGFPLDPDEIKRAKLFLKAIKAHAKANP